jgi:hypothetical protein
MQVTLLEPELVWGLIPRFVGLLYVVAFGSLIPQLELALGTKGLVPIALRLNAIRRDFPGPLRFWQFPTLFWLNSSDWLLRLVPWLGTLCGLCVIYGGPVSPWALALAWFLWLSLEPAALIFPWDTMLQEVGFLALFLPTHPALPLWAATLPDPTVAFMFRWLVVRLMLGFGKLKFIGARKEDRLYLRGFFIWMPLPAPLGWLLQHAPRVLLRAMLAFMFVAEVIAPVLGLFTGPARLVSFALLTALMLGIQLTGNWGFFNVGYILLSFALLDANASIMDWTQEPWRSSFWHAPVLAQNALMLVMFLTGLFYLIVANSWIGRTFMHLDVDRWVWNRPWARVLLKYFRVIAPLRVINGYGVFHPFADPPMRILPVFEGSNDGGATWRAYRYKFMPTQPRDRPPMIAPFHPRFDMGSFYSSMGIFDASFYGAWMGDGSPYTSWTRTSAPERAAQRLLENETLVIKAFRENPFPDGPPELVRVAAVALTPTSTAKQRATGEWWHVQRLGLYLQPRRAASWPFRYTYPVPELFHPDFIGFKRGAVALQEIVRAFQGGAEPDHAIIQGSDLTAADVRAFWDEFVPLVNVARGDFSQHVERADALKQQLGVDGLVRNERILERFAWLLRTRTERFQYADAQPRIPIESSFRYHMFLQEAVCDGRAAYLELLAQPETAAARAARSTDALQLWALTLLRHDIMMYHLCALRWFKVLGDAHKLQVPGFFEYTPLLIDLVPPGEVHRPSVQLLPDGEHLIEGLYPVPERI